MDYVWLTYNSFFFNVGVSYLQSHIAYSWKFLPGENFSSVLSPSLVGKNLSMTFLSCVKDYIEDMATSVALVKIYSTEYFCIQKELGLAKFGSVKNFCYTVHNTLLKMGSDIICDIYDNTFDCIKR